MNFHLIDDTSSKETILFKFNDCKEVICGSEVDAIIAICSDRPLTSTYKYSE